MITRITGKNQVTIPAEIARKEGVRPGTRLDWRSTDREHVLEVHVLPQRSWQTARLKQPFCNYQLCNELETLLRK